MLQTVCIKEQIIMRKCTEKKKQLCSPKISQYKGRVENNSEINGNNSDIYLLFADTSHIKITTELWLVFISEHNLQVTLNIFKIKKIVIR